LSRRTETGIPKTRVFNRIEFFAHTGLCRDKGTYLPYNVDLNHAIYTPAATVADTQQRRPNQDFQTLIRDISGGNSFYNSLQLSLERRMAHGAAFGANLYFLAQYRLQFCHWGAHQY